MEAVTQDKLVAEQVGEVLDLTRPQEAASLVRKLMALQIGQCLGGKPPSQPLSLIDSDTEISDSQGMQGLLGEYVETVKRGLQMRMKMAKAEEEHREVMASLRHEKEDDSEILDLHVKVARLQKQYDKKQTVLKYMELLQKQPAAAPDYLAPEAMYKDCRPLPEIPKQMVDGFATDHAGTDAEVDALVQKLQKTVLRSKLVARREKQRFEQAQARDPVEPSSLTPEAKLHALNAVKNTLINWIESQLSKAGDGKAGSETELSEQPSTPKEKVDLEVQLADIQKKYQRHIELRTEIHNLLAHKDQVKPRQTEEPKSQASMNDVRAARAPPPTAYLITPYIEQLQALSREQKSLIQEKSHISATLAKQQEDTKQTLDHLAQESQLLDKYPATKTSKPKLSFGEATRSGNKSNMTSQVEPWIYAADSAKIATLETVAEKVEEGMMSIDEARQALEKVCKLLNVELPGTGATSKEDSTEKDLWLPEGDDETVATSFKKETGKNEKAEQPKSIWSILDGNLGSINE
ncbi:hypothetical protein BJ170DRAFT_454364 [Xylariales sp. AK1849]|nr:hypothetical protein BJ170DRAFT_454364 [Xylariales sp. AK1849]